ncbi:YceI family protein [Arenimonas alkanexedens]
MRLAWLGGLCLAGAMGNAHAAPAREAVDPVASRAAFEVSLRVTGPVPGRFRRIEGELLEDSPGRWRVQVRVDARGLELDGPAWMLRSTRSAKFLDVEAHPEIRFRSERFPQALLASGGALKGRLELRGKTRGVTFSLLPAGCDRPGRDCDIVVQGEISRRAFGMTSQRVWVRDEVGFDFRVRLRDAVAP